MIPQTQRYHSPLFRRENYVKKLIMLLSSPGRAAVRRARGCGCRSRSRSSRRSCRSWGIKIDPNRFADLTGDPMGAVISLGGCTASFVSPDGLIVTNHHCGTARCSSTPRRSATSSRTASSPRRARRSCRPGRARASSSRRTIEDVTDRVTGKLDAKLTDVDRDKAIEQRQKELVAECEKPGGVRCRVASFFEGAQYLPHDADGDPRRPPRLRAGRSASATSAARPTTGCGRATPATGRSSRVRRQGRQAGRLLEGQRAVSAGALAQGLDRGA